MPEALATRQIDGRLSTLDEMISQGRPGMRVAAILAIDESSGGDGILIRKDANISSVKDFKGKTIALHRPTTSHFLLNYVLHQNGMSEEDVNLKDMWPPEDIVAAIVAGDVDAAVTWQPHLSNAAEDPSVTLFLTSKETPGLIVDVLILHKEVLAAHPEAGKGLIRAWNKAVEYYKGHPDDAAVIMAKALGYDNPEDLTADLAGVTFCGKERNAQLFRGSGPGTARGTLNFAVELWTKELIDGTYLEK
jgi:NitT/TauT family transport system substrate-binding protein